MKKILFILITIILPVVLYGQGTVKPDGSNWKHTGTNEFTKAITVQTKSLTGAKIASYDAAVVKISDSLSLDTVAVLKSDSSYQKLGSYTTRYAFKNEAVRTPYQKIMKNFGSTLKLYPVADYGYPSNNTLVDGRAYFNLCYTPDSLIITGFKFQMATAGEYTGDQYNGIALYSVPGSSGNATKLSETANDVNFWTATANVITTKNLPAPVTIPPGYYYIAYVYNNSAQTTAPQIQGTTIPGIFNGGNGWANSTVGLCSYLNAPTNTLPEPTFDISTFYTISTVLGYIIGY